MFCKKCSIFIYILFIYSKFVCKFVCAFNEIDPDEVRTFGELIESHGFRLQVHHVITDDGYILTVHRVVPPNYDPTTYHVTRKPVIAFHGLLCDATNFYINSPFLHSNDSYCGDNFGLCLIKSGRYDVWTPNARGTRFSRRHLRFGVKDAKFWSFSWDHIALHGVPAVVKLVQSVTGHRTVGYVGHSQGSAIMFALLTHRPEYAQIIRPFISWAPAVFIQHAPSAITAIIDIFSHTLNHVSGELLLTNQPVNQLLQFGACRGSVGNAICSTVLQLLFGPSSSLNETRTPTYFHYFPSPCSNWQMAHFGQIWESGEFARFDYGEEERNIAQYGVSYPPEFELAHVPKDMKLVVMYGATDWLVIEREVHRLLRTFRSNGNEVIEYKVPSDKWNHIDFTNGMGAGRLVYDQTLKYLDDFS